MHRQQKHEKAGVKAKKSREAEGEACAMVASGRTAAHDVCTRTADAMPSADASSATEVKSFEEMGLRLDVLVRFSVC